MAFFHESAAGYNLGIRAQGGCLVDGDFRLASWLVRPNLNTVSRNGVTTQLEPKVMKVLVCLAESPGQPVSKEKLLQTVWPDTFVGDGVLVRSIVELRRIFEDNAKEPQVIQTISKRGYRLLAPVEFLTNGAQPVGVKHSEATAISEPGPTQRTLSRGVFIGAGVGALLLAILGFAPVSWRRHFVFASTRPEIGSIAVLPFQNLSGDTSQEYFVDGMTDELITELSRLNGIKVISRTSSTRYKNTNKSLREIAGELNVDACVEGSVLRSGDKVRITAQLTHAATDKNLWGHTYDGDLQEVFTLEANVANEVAQEIRRERNGNGKLRVRTPRLANAAALDAYLMGEFHQQRFGSGGPPDERYIAAEYFRKAIALDPGFAQAYVALADSYVTNVSATPEEAPIVKDALEKALAIDPELAEAHVLMARFREYHDWDFTGAERDFREAMELEPNSSIAHDVYGDFLNHMGRWSEAEQEEYLAQTLDPKNDHLFDGLFERGEWDRALKIGRNIVAIHPEDGSCHWSLSRVELMLKSEGDEIAELQIVANLYGHPEMAKPIAQTYAKSGYGAALRLWANDLEKTQGNPSSAAMVAEVYLALGDKDESFRWLEKAYAERDGFLVGLKDAEWRPLQADPRFGDLVRRVGLPQ